MSYSTRGHVNVGAYQSPFSGVGVDYAPLGDTSDKSGIILHESGYLPDNHDWNYPGVFSPFWRIMHNSRPGHCILCNDEIIELTADKIILIPPYCYFHCLGQNQVPSLWLIFSYSRNLADRQNAPFCLPPSEISLCLMRHISELIEHNADFTPEPEIFHHSMALLHVVLSHTDLQWQKPTPPYLERVQQHIEANFARPLSNNQLARIAGRSATGLTRAFKREFGSTPAQHITKVRIREACRLLAQSDDSIEEIAELTGFPNSFLLQPGV